MTKWCCFSLGVMLVEVLLGSWIFDEMMLFFSWCNVGWSIVSFLNFWRNYAFFYLNMWICTTYKDLDTSILRSHVFLMIFARSRGPAAQAGVMEVRGHRRMPSQADLALYILDMASFGVAIMASMIYKCTIFLICVKSNNVLLYCILKHV